MNAVFPTLVPDHRCGFWTDGADELEKALRRRADVLREAAGEGTRLLDLAALPDGDGAFDAVIGDQCLEHAVTPEQRLRGQHLGVLSRLFARAHALTVPGTRMALTTLTAGRLPRSAATNRALVDVVREIPLWRRCLRPEDVAKACGRWWEVREVDTHQHDYARTALAWLGRLRDREAPLRAEFGDQCYAACLRAVQTFAGAIEDNQLSLVRLTLWRTDQ
ncbi:MULTISPECIES: hypothetical protein [Amycolatopsis]|uniref:Methyltransferase domain-containing protein n=1 Tax=Amycolatopsis dongchuanensis TaxID=1070866 RepID=A0ABP8VI50_9PSEU